MLTHCPECQKELSTAATQCPHCGAPVNQGHIAGGVPVAQPVSPGNAQPAPAPQSHCFRNCLIAGCVIVLLMGVGFFAVSAMFVNKLKSSFTDKPEKIAEVGQSVAPGATTPAGYEPKFGVNLSWFGFEAKGVFLMKGGDPNQGGTVIGYGAMKGKGDKDQVRDAFQKGLQNAGKGGGEQTVEKEETVELDVGGEPKKVMHMITVDQQSGRKQEMYLLILDDWGNEFGWLGIGAVGPEGKFDLDGFKAFLGSLKKK